MAIFTTYVEQSWELWKDQARTDPRQTPQTRVWSYAWTFRPKSDQAHRENYLIQLIPSPGQGRNPSELYYVVVRLGSGSGYKKCCKCFQRFFGYSMKCSINFEARTLARIYVYTFKRRTPRAQPQWWAHPHNAQNMHLWALKHYKKPSYPLTHSLISKSGNRNAKNKRDICLKSSL